MTPYARCPTSPPPAARVAAPDRNIPAIGRLATSQAQRDVFNRRRQHLHLHQFVEATRGPPQAFARVFILARDHRVQTAVPSYPCVVPSVHRLRSALPVSSRSL